MFPPPIKKLIDSFSRFPTVGPRTAARFVFYLLKISEQEFQGLVNSLLELKKSISLCGFCFNPFEYQGPGQEENLCQICKDKTRDRTMLCIVEKENDLISIEKTKKYKGLYFILGEVISNLTKADSSKIRIKELESRIKEPEKFGLQNPSFQEIIIAINPTPEGDTTSLYIQRRLKELQDALSKNFKITRLGKGLPVGGELEYADQETLESAFEGRK